MSRLRATTNAPLEIVVAPGDEGRIDHLLAKTYPEASRSRLAALFEVGAVRIRGKKAKKGDRVAVGDLVQLTRGPISDEEMRVVPDPDAAAQLIVLYDAADVVVVAKPPGMPSQPLNAGERGTAAGGVVHLFPECAEVSDEPRDGGLVHRLDIGTSGALIAAKTRAAWQALRAAFGAGGVDKEYLALVETAPVSAECDAPLIQRGKKAIVDLVEGLPAHTEWTTVSRHGERRLLRCKATTGRTHQVRAHLAHVGAPIVGDVLYGGQPFPGLVQFFLHASVVRFPGPHGVVQIDAPLPPDRKAVLDSL